ncbi:HAD hydrolase-like protein [Thermosynechococcus sp. HN-54]|uniref:HAD family hydrolase n=1 Tax=Thermosynechococcus sp. HN-54 TaxID=2933959 RepID=UPI00202D09F8|nr:HAD hydrolase-like protein [Thermosynechococcus sp. HN-54]URR35475.1 HAD hydrolase-like protein [Thermosynechococcus sp. HN-54]
MMNDSKIITIDLDGTIVDCYPRQAAVTEYILKELGIGNIEFQLIWKHKRSGLSTVAALNSYFPEVNSKIINCFVIRWLELIEQPCWIKLDRLFPWSRSSLETLKSMNFSLVLLTARQRPENVLTFLKINEIDHLFSWLHIVSPQNAAEEKASLLLQVKPLYHCGDSETDALAAEKANVRFIGVSCGQRSREFLEQYDSLTILDDIRRLPQSILQFST